MYSPKIKEKHIPLLYRLAKVKGIPMTKLVDQIINDYLDRLEGAFKEMKAREITKEIFERRRHENKKRQANKALAEGPGDRQVPVRRGGIPY